MKDEKENQNVCGATTVFWPEEESIDARCSLPEGHTGHHEDGWLDWQDEE